MINVMPMNDDVEGGGVAYVATIEDANDDD
jgi:hypothetical protein